MKQIWKVLFNTGKGFYDDGCSTRAAALTFFTLVSLVPVLAVALGLARGFGFAQLLEAVIKDQLREQPEVASYIINFAYSLLENTSSGLIAGVGLVLLLWSVYNILGNIEEALNYIWKIPNPRSWVRKITDYMATMIICPLFFVISSSLTIYLKTHFTVFSELYRGVAYVEYFLIHLFPYLFSWLLFTFLYFFLPNRRIPLKYGMIGAFVGGTAYQLLQTFYISIQFKLSSFGAIYGSFAALPLFLLWLNLSWMIILAGAELAYQAEIAAWNHPPTDPGFQQIFAPRRVLALLIVYACIQAFKEGKDSLTLHQLSEKYGASKKNLDEVIRVLVKYKILSETAYESDSEIRYQPARDIKNLTLKTVDSVFPPLDDDWVLLYKNPLIDRFQEILASYDAAISHHASNLRLSQVHPLEV